MAAAVVMGAVASAAENKPLTGDNMWAVQRVGTPALSPDGKTFACTVSVYDMDENRSKGDVWIVPLARGTPSRLTANKASDGSPDWSPDGKRLALTSKRDDDSRRGPRLRTLFAMRPERRW